MIWIWSLRFQLKGSLRFTKRKRNSKSTPYPRLKHSKINHSSKLIMTRARYTGTKTCISSWLIHLHHWSMIWRMRYNPMANSLQKKQFCKRSLKLTKCLIQLPFMELTPRVRTLSLNTLRNSPRITKKGKRDVKVFYNSSQNTLQGAKREKGLSSCTLKTIGGPLSQAK